MKVAKVYTGQEWRMCLERSNLRHSTGRKRWGLVQLKHQNKTDELWSVEAFLQNVSHHKVSSFPNYKVLLVVIFPLSLCIQQVCQNTV